MPEKKDSSPATTSETRPDAANQQVVQVLLDLLKEARQRAATPTAAEPPPEVAFANAEFALLERGLRLETPFRDVRINPTSGRSSAETTVAITGANFVPPATISFDDPPDSPQTPKVSRPATNVTVKSPTEITATAPRRDAGTGTGTTPVDVVITTFGGTVRLVKGFTYTP